MKQYTALALSFLLIASGLGLSSCQHKCPAMTGGYVAPPPKVGKHHKPQTGLWGPGMKKKKH